MDIPWWFSVASAIFFILIAAMIIRFVMGLKRRMDSGEIEPGDDWDPFR